MSSWSPPTVPAPWVGVGAVFFLLWLAYCLLIIQQLLLGVLPLFVFAGLYLTWRMLAALEAIADAQQRLADSRERDEERR